MGKIRKLPESLANQIAAGEVVERPAAVVKELVENAIDAGATRVSVTVELGGKRSIRVEDNGEGMTPDDARLALERHATSKIREAADLAHIATLGFRGEALPSIASVSRFVLRTRARGTASGVEIRVDGGEFAAPVEQGMAEGTSIEVADLFFNQPARRKFLRSDTAEAAHISRIVTQLALGAPAVGFTLTSAGRVLLQAPPAASVEDRLYQLYGGREDLVPVRRDGDVRVTGHVAALAEQGPRRGPQNVFVNGRVVKDRTIMHAIGDAYSVASIKERSPEVHLFIELPADAVDVNVHPTKAEVRFRDQSHVHQTVRRALADALGRSAAPALTLDRPGDGRALPWPVATPGRLPGSYAPVLPSRWTTSVPDRAGVVPSGDGGADLARETTPAAFGDVAAGVAAFTPGRDEALTSQAVDRPMMPLGQFRDTFIIAVDDEGIAIIDQHVAHERVLFERIMERLGAGRLESQRLLVPRLVALPPSGRQALAAHGAALHELGFEVDEFGGDEVRMTAAPALLGLDDAEAALRALAEDLEGLDHGAGVSEALKRIAATMACHAAVKAHDPLTPEKMQHILEELRRTAYSTICPHGRPVLLRVTRREVEKSFQRI